MSEKTPTNPKTNHDTFMELQAELVRQHERGEAHTENKDRKKDLQDIVAGLARQGGFNVEAVLGVGGMGTVVRATDVRLKREVALKFLPPAMVRDDKKIAELRREAEVASRIKHENVVSILSWHEVENVPFYAMELVEGETLEDYVRRRGKLPPHEALRIIIEATRGVEELHNFGIVHRDIKPSNILISRDGRVKITDFGISRTQDAISLEAHQNKIAGTPQFMAPEQARGEAATKHSDIYSLGATLYYSLTGRAPVRNAPNVREQLKVVGEGKPMPILGFLPKLDREVARVVMKSLNANPSRRAFDIGHFRQELEQAFLAQSRRSQSSFAAWWRYLKFALPMVTLLVGAAAGVLAGWHFAESAAPPPPPRNPDPVPPVVSPLPADGMILLMQHDVDILKQIADNDQSAIDARVLLDDYNRAAGDKNATQLMLLSTSISREIDRWVAQQTARMISGLAPSPLQYKAASSLTDITRGNKERIDDWNRSWIKHLSEYRITPTPVPDSK